MRVDQGNVVFCETSYDNENPPPTFRSGLEFSTSDEERLEVDIVTEGQGPRKTEEVYVTRTGGTPTTCV